MADDLYAILGVDRRASQDEIKKAYRRLTLDHHPDRRPDDELARERFRDINRAYDTLGDPARRARYDASMLRSDAIDLAQGFDGRSARDLLGDVFGDIFGARKRERRRGRDVRYTLTVDFEEAVLGSSHTIEFEAPGGCPDCDGDGVRPGGERPVTCEHCDGRGELKGAGLLSRRTRCGRCDGTGMVHRDACKRCRGRGTVRQKRAFTVRVPAGTEPGAERRVAGEGEPGRFGGDPGDLRVTINVREHPFLQRDGSTIRCDLPVTIVEAARGGRVPVPTVDGVVTMDVPAGVASGARLRLRGKGVPSSAGSRGDQIVTVVVETPNLRTAGDDVQRALDALGAALEASGAAAQPARENHRRWVRDAEGPDAQDPGED